MPPRGLHCRFSGVATFPPNPVHRDSSISLPPFRRSRRRPQKSLLNRRESLSESARLPLPGYLDRQEIVTRVAQNQINLAENDRWAEPLEENFSRVLSQNVAAILRADQGNAYPWAIDKKPVYLVEVEVLRFEAKRSKRCNWRRAGRCEIPARKTRCAIAKRDCRGRPRLAPRKLRWRR